MTGRGVRGWLASSRFALILVIVQPILLKVALLLGILKSDPRLIMSGLGSADFRGLGGTPTIDPNIAFTSHALGTLAARSVAAGEPVWWNPYEGVGAPLAGEMQSAALFPLTWLMVLPNGQLLEHLAFQIIAGVATFFLLRRLGLGVLACWFGATAFSFNGTYGWLANAVANPICFLPVILLGVEMLRDRAVRAQVGGGVLLSLGLAESLYAGFPETAYLNGLLVAGWTIMRLLTAFDSRRELWAFVARVGGFGVAGCLLAAPAVLPFVDYLWVSYIGGHDGTAPDGLLRPVHAAMMLVPYLPGAMSRGHVEFWGAIGGYAGITLAVLAIAGLRGAIERPLRLFLAGWSVVALAAIYGVEPVITLVNLIPGVANSVVYRYVEPSVFLALAVLAAFALEELAAAETRLRALRRVFLGVVVVAALLAVYAVSEGLRPTATVEMLLIVGQLGLVALFAGVLFLPRLAPERRAALLAGSAALEIAMLFAVPLLSYPFERRLELGGVRYMQANIGNQRFVSLGDIGKPGVISANYGSYFGIGQINWNDLPAPSDWVDYVRRHIEPRADPIIFRTDAAQLLRALPAYAAVGTRFVTTPLDEPLPQLRQVFSDSLMRIYAVPGTRPYLTAPGCTLRIVDRKRVTTDCPAPSRVERLELMMPGWTATVNGADAPVARTGEIFQAVAVPAGAASVTFAFVPPSLTLAKLLAVAGLLLWGATAALVIRRGRAVVAAA